MGGVSGRLRAALGRSPLAGDAVGSGLGTRDSGLGRAKASPASRLLAVFCVILMALSSVLHAQAIEALPFANRAQEVRFQQLTAQLRCPMCQNETLADSNAPIARDLRHQVFALMQQGRSDTQIKQYLVDRYSTYVLYDPPVKPGTWLLWFGPLAILLGGAAVVVMTIRRRSRAGTPVQGGSHGTPLDEDDW